MAGDGSLRPRSLSEPTLVGSRCTLRPWTAADAPALREACGDEAICRYTTVPEIYDELSAAAWVDRQLAHARDGDAIVLAIVTDDDAVPVGMMGVYGLDQHTAAARLGYWLTERARGRGLATAAARLLIGYATHTLGRSDIAIEVEPDNAASRRVARRLGATYRGTRRAIIRGEPVMLERYVVSAPCE